MLNEMTGYHILFNIDPILRNKENLINSFLHINISENYNLIRIFHELAALEKEEKDNTEQKKESVTAGVKMNFVFEEELKKRNLTCTVIAD